MDWGLWDHLRAEADVIAHAPLAFLLFLIVGCAIGAAAVQALNKATISGLRTNLDFWKDKATHGEPVAPVASSQTKITSHDQKGGITAQVVNVGKQDYEMTPAEIARIIAAVPHGKPIKLAVYGNKRAPRMKAIIEKALRGAGFEVEVSHAAVSSSVPERPIMVSLLPKYTVVTLAPD